MKILKSCFLLGFLLFLLEGNSQQAMQVLPLPDGALLNSNANVIQTAKNAVTQTANATTFEVIDATGDSLILGYMPTKENNNDRIAIVSPVSKGEWLQALITDNILGILTGRGNILYILNDISVGRFTTGNYIRLKANVYESAVGTNAYRLIKTVDEFTTDNAGNITAIGSSIGNTITNTVSLLGGIIKIATEKTLTRNEVIQTEKEKYKFISNNNFPTGIYMSYDELKAGKPSFEQFFIKTDTITKKIIVNSFTINDSTLHPVTSAWAIAVRNELYIYKNDKLYPAEAFGNNLIFSKYIDPATRKNNGMFWRSTVGNRFSNEHYKNPFDNIYALEIINYRNRGIKGEAIKINADSGVPEL